MKQTAAFLSLLLVGVLLSLSLGGCDPAGRLQGSGVPVEPPYGYTKLCKEQPDFVSCTNTKGDLK